MKHHVTSRSSVYNMKHNYPQNSEIIIRKIINKIISLSISKSIREHIEKNIFTKCFDFIKENINNYLNVIYLPHDREEVNNNYEVNNNSNNTFFCGLENITPLENIDEKNISFSKNNINEIFFFNNAYEGENNWDFLKEPYSGKMDRYSSNFISYEPFSDELKSKYKIEKKGIVLEEEDDEESNKLTEEKSKFSKIVKEKEKSEINLKTAKKISQSHFKNDEKTNININEKKEKKININEIMNQFSFHDIPDLQKTSSNNEINKLREEYEEHKKHESIEIKTLNEYKQKLIIKRNPNIENLKQYIGKRINIDHNGKIIFIKDIKIKDLKPDFFSVKSKLKINTNITNLSESKTEAKKNLKKIKILVSNNNRNLEKNNPIIKNENINNYNNINNNKRRRSILKNNKELKESELIKKKLEKPIIPGGSSFNLMNMECGVILKEEKKIKSGGLDFFSKYKKFSTQFYNKKLKETKEANDLKANIELNNDDIQNNGSLMSDDYHINFTQNFQSSSFNNISQKKNNFSQSDLHNNMNINNTKYFYSTNNSSMFNSYINNLKKTKYYNRNQKNNFLKDPLIKVSIGSSLMEYFDKLNLLSTDDIKNNQEINNIFKKKENNISIINFNSFEDINKFNREIITGKNTKSNYNLFKNSFLTKNHPEKPGNLEMSREVGLKGKIFRNRSKLFTPLKSILLENENFFKK